MPETSSLIEPQPEPLVVDAPHPFNNEDADIILRSSDLVDYRVHRYFLSFSSPVFESMFSLPQSLEESKGDSSKEGLPVVSVQETSGTLQRLLQLCYPMWKVGKTEWETLDGVADLLEAALKYDMEGVQKHIREELIAPRWLEEDPLRVFVIAYSKKLERETRLAAQYTSKSNVPVSQRHFVSELSTIPAAALLRLEEYHSACRRAASLVPVFWRWIPTSAQFIWFDLRSTHTGCELDARGGVISNVQKVNPRTWWLEYMRDLRAALQEAPCVETVMKADLLDKAKEKAASCSLCSFSFDDEMEEFRELMAAEVTKELAKVVLRID